MSKTTETNYDLSYFMAKSKPENVEYPAPERFKDKDGNPIMFVFRVLSEDEMREIRSHHKQRKIALDPKTRKPLIANGKVVMDENYDSTAAIEEMLVESLIYPNLRDPELMESYKCYEDVKMPAKMFTFKELLYLYDAFNKIHGYADEEDDESESDIDIAKN